MKIQTKNCKPIFEVGELRLLETHDATRPLRLKLGLSSPKSLIQDLSHKQAVNLAVSILESLGYGTSNDSNDEHLES